MVTVMTINQPISQYLPAIWVGALSVVSVPAGVIGFGVSESIAAPRFVTQTSPSPVASISQPNNQSQPDATTRQCLRAVATAQKKVGQVKQVRVLQPQKINISGIYQDFPSGRPDQYQFRLVGKGVATVLYSPKFMQAISQDLISQCTTVSLVTFGEYQTDWYLSFGLMANNKLEAFQCVEPGVKLKWGEQACP
jgi:hypothetical protein